MLKHSRRKLTMGFLSCILFVNVNNHSPFCLGAGYKVKPELRISKWSPTFPRLEPNLLPGLFFLCLQLGSMILIGSDWTNEREFCLQCLMVFIIDLHTLAQCKFRKLNYYFHNVFILGDFNTSDNSWDVKKNDSIYEIYYLHSPAFEDLCVQELKNQPLHWLVFTRPKSNQHSSFTWASMYTKTGFYSGLSF